MVHQLNLALKGLDQTRLNIAIHSERAQARQTGSALSGLLGVPLADQVDDHAPAIATWTVGSHNTQVRKRAGYSLVLVYYARQAFNFRSLFSGEGLTQPPRWCASVEFWAKGYWRLHQPVTLGPTKLHRKKTHERHTLSDIAAVRLAADNFDNKELRGGNGKVAPVDANPQLGQVGLVLKGQCQPCLLAVHADPAWARQISRTIADFLGVPLEDQLHAASEGAKSATAQGEDGENRESGGHSR